METEKKKKVAAAVKILRSTVVTPAAPPIGAAKSSIPDELPFTIFDLSALDVHTGSFTAFRGAGGGDTNDAIIDGLSRTLTHFPTLNGRIGKTRRGWPCFLLGGGGVLVVEAVVPSTLDELLPLEPSPEMEKLHPPRGEGTPFLLQIQLNRFQCGGLLLGLTVDHRAADAQSMGIFLNLWGKLVRGLSPPPPFPVHVGATSLLEPRNPPRISFPHLGNEFLPSGGGGGLGLLEPKTADPNDIENVLVHYTREYIDTKLKAGMVGERYCTTFKAVAAHLWRKITAARGLDAGEITTMTTSVNCRTRLRPTPAPPESSFGNMTLLAHPSAAAGDLLAGSIADAASAIHDAVEAVSDEYIRSFIDFGAAATAGEEEGSPEMLVASHVAFGNVMSPYLDASSSLGFGFDGVDFGGGPPASVMPLWIPVEGVLFFLPSGRDGGGVEVVVTLLREHADALRKISHSLS